MAKPKDYINLMRVRQWYKNLIVFLALVFSENLFNGELFWITVLAFISLSLVSSAGYVINDIGDRKKDQLHSEKRYRPIAAGRIKAPAGVILVILLLLIGLTIAYSITTWFFVIVASLFIVTQIYTFYLKNILFADILTISTLFAIRAISGGLAIDVRISPWLILCPFFLAMFLGVGKRKADIHLMKKEASKTRKVLEHYTETLTNQMMTLSTVLLIVSYSLYSFLSEHPNLIYTLPFALYTILQFFHLINRGSTIARNPEEIFKNKPVIIGLILWIIITGMLIYV
jgi:4-hydroxybenzoate polyprenyltransferase